MPQTDRKLKNKIDIHMMGFLYKSIKATNLVVLFLFLACCYYSLCVKSELSPAGNQAALTVVEQKEDSADDDDGIVAVEENDVTEPMDVFYPSKNWKTIKEGQAIPSGLHVRMNLQTGKKEAKLMDGDSGVKYWETDGRKGMLNTKKKQFTRDELKEALKHFKAHVNVKDEKQTKEDVKKKFRTYEELKEELAKAKMSMKTDGELVAELVDMFRKAASDSDKKAILTDLEYYLHQIDNAVLFCDLGAMPDLIKCLNDTNEEIRTEAAFVLGSALQSNPKVQISAVENGAIQSMLRILSTETSFAVKKKTLYALSSILRHFPYAQKKFLELGGLASLKKLFDEITIESGQLQVRAVTLMYDLVTEKELTLKDSREDKFLMEKKKQYNEVKLKDGLKNMGWCKLIPRLLDIGEHDSREKVLNAMMSLTDVCRSSFTSARLTLNRLLTEYEHLAKEEVEEDGFFKSLVRMLNVVFKSLYLKEEL